MNRASFFYRNWTHERGLSVVELMVAMVLGLIIVGGVISLFGSSRKTYESNDQLIKIQENGQFALNSIVRDIREAGYKGCAKAVPFNNTLNPTDATSPTGLFWNFQQAVFGYEATGAAAWTPAIDATEIDSPTTSNTVGNDILVLRALDRNTPSQDLIAPPMATGSDVLNVTSPSSFQVGDVVLAADCNASAVFQVTDNAGALSHVAAAGVPGNASGDLGWAFQTGAEVSKISTVVYYVHASTSGTSTSLFRRVGSSPAEELVEGVDSFQVKYGIDTDNDGLPDSYVNADAVPDWNKVVDVKIGLLIRSIDEYGADQDSTSHTVLDQVVPAFNDRRQRQVFATTTTLRNHAL